MAKISNELKINMDELIPGGEDSNVKVTVVGNQLIFVVDLTQDLGVTTSGKSITIAATRGYATFPEGMRASIWIGRKVTP